MVSYFDEQIAIFHSNLKTRAEAFDLLAAEFRKKDLVTPEFREEIGKREIVYPTGLQIGKIGVAIPHTDSTWVKKSQLGFLSLTNPVSFFQMGTNDTSVKVSLIFMMALKEPHEQLEMLQNLITMFQEDGKLAQFEKVNSFDDYIQLIHRSNLF